VTPTRLRALLALAVLTSVLGWVVINSRTGDLLELPYLAPVTAGLIAVFELGLAKVVRDKLRGRGRGRQLHALQIARAAVLAKASSSTGALLAGLYAGLWVWFFQHGELRVAADNAVVAAVSVGACVLLVVAALLLERACRVPDHQD
jgi:hypothetical protein